MTNIIKCWKCCGCENIFIYPKEVTENVGFKEHPYYQTELLCPKCKSGNIEEIEVEETEEIKKQIKMETMIREEEMWAEAMLSYYRY